MGRQFAELIDDFDVGLGNLEIAPWRCARLDQERDRVEREEGNDRPRSVLVGAARYSNSVVEHEPDLLGVRAGHELVVDLARYAHGSPPNGWALTHTQQR